MRLAIYSDELSPVYAAIFFALCSLTILAKWNLASYILACYQRYLLILYSMASLSTILSDIDSRLFHFTCNAFWHVTCAHMLSHRLSGILSQKKSRQKMTVDEIYIDLRWFFWHLIWHILRHVRICQTCIACHGLEIDQVYMKSSQSTSISVYLNGNEQSWFHLFPVFSSNIWYL